MKQKFLVKSDENLAGICYDDLRQKLFIAGSRKQLAFLQQIANEFPGPKKIVLKESGWRIRLEFKIKRELYNRVWCNDIFAKYGMEKVSSFRRLIR